MLMKVSRRMNDLGYFPANDGNLSCKISPEAFITIAGGVYKGDIEADMLVTVGLDGTLIEAFGSVGLPSDAEMHIQVFRQYPMIFAAINAQPRYATRCALTGKPLDEALLPATVTHLGVVPIVPYAKPGSPELAAEVGKRCVGHTALLLENRGLLAWGENLYEAWQRFQTAEQYAELTWTLAGRPDKRLLPPEARDALVKDRERYCLYMGGTPFAADEK
jgi:L-fuculose-phosphate aldolase